VGSIVGVDMTSCTVGSCSVGVTGWGTGVSVTTSITVSGTDVGVSVAATSTVATSGIDVLVAVGVGSSRDEPHAVSRHMARIKSKIFTGASFRARCE
jgi:hypothetical protein